LPAAPPYHQGVEYAAPFLRWSPGHDGDNVTMKPGERDDERQRQQQDGEFRPGQDSLAPRVGRRGDGSCKASPLSAGTPVCVGAISHLARSREAAFLPSSAPWRGSCSCPERHMDRGKPPGHRSSCSGRRGFLCCLISRSATMPGPAAGALSAREGSCGRAMDDINRKLITPGQKKWPALRQATEFPASRGDADAGFAKSQFPSRGSQPGPRNDARLHQFEGASVVRSRTVKTYLPKSGS